jgi:hypothetical protein
MLPKLPNSLLYLLSKLAPIFLSENVGGAAAAGRFFKIGGGAIGWPIFFFSSAAAQFFVFFSAAIGAAHAGARVYPPMTSSQSKNLFSIIY